MSGGWASRWLVDCLPLPLPCSPAVPPVDLQRLHRTPASCPCRASRCTKGLPRLMQNLMTRHTAAALQQGGHPQQAAALRDAAKLCREAAAVAAAAAEGTGGGGAAVAGLASVARQRADFWRAARRPWKVGGHATVGRRRC